MEKILPRRVFFLFRRFFGVQDDYGWYPPLAADAFEGTSGTFADTNASLKNHAYIYRYDGHGRIIYKKLPGCEPVYYIYDKGGRLILSQDGVQRPLNKWTFTIPDVHGRTVLKGECTSSSLDYSACPYASTVVKATRNNGTSYFGYSIGGITLSSAVMHSVYYYDDYAFIGKNNVPTSLNYTTPSTGYGVRYTGGYRGVLTGEVHGNLISDRSVNGYTYAAHYYDSRGRVIQSVRTNHMAGKDTEYVGYDFTGNPLKRKHVHTASGKTTRTEEYSYSYDHAGRMMTESLAIDGKTTTTSYSYDKFGRPASVQYNSKAALRTSYTYNVRSWLSAQTGSLFGQNLSYDSGGNIATQQWTQNGNTRTYTYGYNGLERLKSAAYSGSGNFATAYTYDKSGNMKTLHRYNSSLIDNLTYTYSGNRITKVEDATGNAAGFKNGSTATTEYTYDNNGNLTKDSNKGIASITYNSLNLPSVVTFSNGSTVTYTYSADGKKLSTEHVISGTTTITNYAGNVVYENNVQKKLLTEEGYVDLTSGTYYYYLKDHQGNNRVVVNSGGTVTETNHYYPFGGTFASGTVQPYKYNGKELDTKAGLNWYDYGARHYDAALGRFTTQDPLAKDYYATSPYGYCLNNPVKYIDPDGKDARISIQGNTITITSNIVLTGSMATEQLAQAYQKNIMDNWGKLTTYKYNDVVYDIVWDVNVRVAEEGESLVHDGTNNFLEVVKGGSNVENTNKGKIRGTGWASKSFDETNPMSHEFGHILGLKDKYKKIKMENGKYDYITLKGWQNNIMGEYSGEGKVEYKNLDYILPNVIHHFNLFENLTDIAPWTEYYFINGNNREK